MSNALVPELSVSNWRKTKEFYCELLGFECVYSRPEEGFCYLKLGQAELMIDQIGLGRTFDDGHCPQAYPFGQGVNLQISVPSLTAILSRLEDANYPLFVEPETKTYRVGNKDVDQTQFVVTEPDGYLLRMCQE